MNRRILAGIFIGGVLIAGCDGSAGKEEVTYSGTLEMTEHAVGFAVPGRIAGVYVDEGDTVAKGQLLAVLEHYDQAQKDYDRAGKVLASGGISLQEYEHLKQALDDLTVSSPVDGVVLTRIHESGEAVMAAAPVFIIGENEAVWVRVYVPEDAVSRVSLKQKASIRIDGLTDEIPGYISFISPRAEFTPRNVQTPEERATQVFEVKIMLDDPGRGRPGVSADVSLRDAYRSSH